MTKRVWTGLAQIFLLMSTILFLISCTRTEIVRVPVTPSLLEPCPMPHRVRYSNRGLRQYTIELHKSLSQCNIDKEAIKKELGQ